MLSPSLFHNARILIVDDLEQNVRLLKQMLESAGYTALRGATDPREGLRIFREFDPDLILLDLDMPHLDGFQVMEETRVLRKSAEGDYLPILMLTGDTDQAHRLRALSSGAKDFLNKPFDTHEVLARVHNLLEVRLLHTLLREKNRQLDASYRESERLLLNVLPREVARELKARGAYQPVRCDDVSVMFADFEGFTRTAEALAPARLVEELEGRFSDFDAVAEEHGLEKLKTVGDCYMAAGGIPETNRTHAVDCVLAGLAMLRAAERRPWERASAREAPEMSRPLDCARGRPEGRSHGWELRVGIHTGPVMAGVIGRTKFAYDVWGDTVNTASRMESSGEPGKVNVSGATYDRIRNFFVCEPRGPVRAKNKGEVEMYFVLGLRPELSEGDRPNERFREMYEMLRGAGGGVNRNP